VQEVDVQPQPTQSRLSTFYKEVEILENAQDAKVDNATQQQEPLSRSLFLHAF